MTEPTGKELVSRIVTDLLNTPKLENLCTEINAGVDPDLASAFSAHFDANDCNVSFRASGRRILAWLFYRELKERGLAEDPDALRKVSSVLRQYYGEPDESNGSRPSTAEEQRRLASPDDPA